MKFEIPHEILKTDTNRDWGDVAGVGIPLTPRVERW